jgi:hypothetical protein
MKGWCAPGAACSAALGLAPRGTSGATFCGQAVRGLTRLRFAPLTQSRPGSRFCTAQLFFWALLPRPLVALGGSTGARRPTEVL